MILPHESSNVIKFVIAYLGSYGICALIAVAFGMSIRSGVHPVMSRLIVGGLFGLAAALGMLNPIPITTGVFVDSRNLFIGLSAAFLGPVGALASLAFAAPMRIWMGGAGVAAGLLSMTVAASAGLVWAYLMRDKICTRIRCLLLLGVLLSTALVGSTLLPRDAMMALLTNAAPYIVAFNLVGAVLFGALMERERVNARSFGQLREQATTDPLTGLLNRRGFDMSLERILKNDQAVDSAIVVVDLDHFKQINDDFGHDIGDQVIKRIAQLLKENFRKFDILSRFGGEEFVIFMPNSDASETRRICEKLRISVAEISDFVEKHHIKMTISLGAYISDKETELSECLHRADQALYRAKYSGRNRLILSGATKIAA